MRDPLIPSMRTFRPFWKLAGGSASLYVADSLALAVGVEIVDVNDVAVGQSLEARHALVPVEVDLGVHALQFLVALTPVVEPGEDDPGVVHRPFRDHQFMALDTARLIDQGSGRRPVGVVQGGFVQRLKDALEQVLLAHDDPSKLSCSQVNNLPLTHSNTILLLPILVPILVGTEGMTSRGRCAGYFRRHVHHASERSDGFPAQIVPALGDTVTEGEVIPPLVRRQLAQR